MFFPQKSGHEHLVLNQSKNFKIIHLIYDKLLTFGECVMWLKITVKYNFKLLYDKFHPLKFVVQQFEVMFYRYCQLCDVLTEGD